MKPSSMEDNSGLGAGAGRRSGISHSLFKGWRKRHRQVNFLSEGSKKMTDGNNNFIAADHHNNPAMMNATAVAENTHRGSGTTSVPQSTQEKSVVGPLMGVFEDLCKSSTPQVPPLSVGSKRGSESNSRPMRSKKSRLSDSDNSNAPKRRKGKTSTDDQRWSKRFTWPDELHREFVSAIFDVGLKHSSPSAIMEFMRPNPNITSERVKSHLQKYRKNRDRSRKEFMTSYENSLQGYKNQSGEEFDDDSDNERGGLTCGEAAAFCTHAVSSQRGGDSYDSSTSRRSSPVPLNNSGGTLQLPMLSTEERDGPIGRSFDCLMGLFQSLSQQLEASRGGGIKVAAAAPSAPVPASSQSQQHPSHQRSIPHSVEQAVVNATSSMHHSSSFNEVAYKIPHSLSEPIRVSNQAQAHHDHHQWQRETSREHQHQPSQHDYYDTHAAHHPQKPAPQYHSYDEIPHIPHSPRPTHADPGKPQAQMAAAPQYAHSRPMQHAPAHGNQYQSAPQEYQATLKPPPLPSPQQSSASTTKAQKESTIMEQEMRGQRAFQNKMRAMMQNEMNKYGGNDHGTQSGVAASSDNTGHATDHSEVQAHSSNEHDSPHMTHEPDNQFWNIENDDEIFDFLMHS